MKEVKLFDIRILFKDCSEVFDISVIFSPYSYLPMLAVLSINARTVDITSTLF